MVGDFPGSVGNPKEVPNNVLCVCVCMLYMCVCYVCVCVRVHVLCRTAVGRGGGRGGIVDVKHSSEQTWQL